MRHGLAVFAAAAAAALAWQPSAALAAITVVDDFDRIVTLRAPAERIISLAPHITENLFFVGAGAHVVAVVAPGKYPPGALNLPIVGNHAQVNLEAVVALAPDLVVAWETAGNRTALRKIAQLGYPLYYSEPRDFAAIIDNIQDMARLSGRGDRMAAKITRLRDELTAVRARFQDKTPLTAFYQVWGEPLITINGEHLLSQALEFCGARNVFAHLPIIAPRVGIEAVLQANPDLIITSKTGGEAQLARWRKWTSMSAIRRDGVVLVDGAVMHRHTARMIFGIRGLCEAIDQVRRGTLARD